MIAGLFGWLRERRPEFAPVLSWCVLLSLAVDIGWHLGSAPTRPWEVVETRPAMALALERAGVGLEGGSYEWTYSVPQSMDERLPHWRELQTEFQLLTLAPDSGALFGLPTARAYLAGVTRRVFDLRASPQWNSLAPRFGVCARVVTFEGATPPAGHLAADTDVGVAVMPVAPALPRAYVAFSTREVPDAEQLDVLPAAAQLVVEPGSGLPGSGVARPAQAVTALRSVDRLELGFELASPGVLVVNEAWSRGWSASIDGVPAEVIIANHAVLGLHVPAGTHSVRFEYSTPGLQVGLLLSVLSGLLLLAWTVARRPRRRFPSPA